MFHIQFIRHLCLVFLALIMPLQPALSSEHSRESAHADILVTITDKDQDATYLFNELSKTESTVVGTVADTLHYFQNAESSKAYDKKCNVDLSKVSIETSCNSKNGINQLSVTQQDSQSLYAICDASKSGFCDNFIAACKHIGGGVSTTKDGGASCFVSESVAERVAQNLKYQPDTQKACAQQSSTNNSYTAEEGEGDDEDVVNHCISVSDCNDFIALCAETGGDFTPDSFDPDNGAPSTGSCTYSSDDC